MLLLVGLMLMTAVCAQEQITSTVPSLILFNVNHCEDCDAARPAWDALPEYLLHLQLLLDEVNCDFQERTCHDYQITTFPSVLYVSESGIREFQEDFTTDNLVQFIHESEAVLINKENLLSDEEIGLLHITEADLDVLGKSHSIVYFMYDEEVQHVEDFVLSLRARVSEQFDLPIYIVDCGEMTDICIEEPFLVRDLPSIKYLGEKILGYAGELDVAHIETWLHVHVFHTREAEEGDVLPPEQPDTSLVYLTSDAEFADVAYMEGVLLAFFLNEDSVELEDLFKTLSHKYSDNKDMQIFAVHCDEYNAPKVCQEFPELPAIQHGFMGRLVKKISLSTVEQFDDHIAKLLQILAEGGHILEGTTEKKKEEEEEKEEEESKGEQVEQEEQEEERSGHALIVTSNNYNSTLQSNKLVLLKFFVPWCGHCQKLKPTWKLLAHSFREVTDIVIGMVNCQNEQELCRKHLIYGYPSLFGFVDGKQTYRYREDRTLNNLITFVKDKYYLAIEDDLKYNDTPFKLTSKNVWNVLGVRKYTMTFFTAESCEPCSANLDFFHQTWTALKDQPTIYSQLMLSVVDCNRDLDMCQELGVRQVPYIIMFDVDEKIDPSSAPTDPFLNPFRAVQSQINNSPKHVTLDVVAWHKKTRDMKQELAQEQAKQELRDVRAEDSLPPPQASQQPAKTEPITELSSDTFKAQLKKSRFTFVKFYTPWCGHCRKLAPTWEQLANKFFLSADIVFANVNCDANEKLCDKHKVNVYPTLYMFENDRKLKHSCKKRKIGDLEALVKKFLSSEPPQGIVADNKREISPERSADKKLVEVQGPLVQLDRAGMLALLESPHYNYIFVNFQYSSEANEKLSATWDRLATLYTDNENIVIAAVDCEVELRLCVRYQVAGAKYPQLLLFDKINNINHVCKKRSEYELTAYIDKFLEGAAASSLKDEL